MLKRDEFLEPDHLPSEIFHREREIDQIRVAIEPITGRKKGENLFIYGVPGVGKTTTIKHILSNSDIQHVYVNCWVYRTAHAFLGEIARQLGIPVPRKGKGTDEIVEKIVRKGDMVVVLDEVDKAERVDDIYTLIESTNSVFIFITNNREWIFRLEPRVSSRLFLVNMEFKPYSFEQMHDIIKERIKLAFKPGSISPEVATEVARRAFLKKDVRRGLFLLKKISKIEDNRAEMDVFEKIDEDFVLKPMLTDKEEGIRDIIKNNQGKTTGDIYRAYVKSGGKLTQRAFRMYLKKMQEKSLINLEETGEGFRGRSRRIFLNEKYGV